MTDPPSSITPPRSTHDGAHTRARRLFGNYVALCERHPFLLVAVFALLAGLAVVPVLRLELRTDLSELLPADHPALRAIKNISGRQKSSTNLVLLVESPDAAANRRFMAALRPKMEQLCPSVFSEIQWRPETEVPDYFQAQRWLYADRADLESAERLLNRLVAGRGSLGFVDLEGDPEEELKALRKRMNDQLGPLTQRPAPDQADTFHGEDQGLYYLGAMMWRRGDGLATLGDRMTMERADEVVRGVNPASFHPRMKASFTGHIAMALDEHDAVRDGLTRATVLCTTLVLLVIYLYFRRAGLILVLGAPAVLGVLLSLSLAWLAYGGLNANTAFLISIILGNGINSPIILLARYGEERRRGEPVGAALLTAMSGTLVGTVTATMAASISYGCLLLTTFRGFNQFGLVGGVGMLLVWLLAYLMVPPLVIAGERLRPGMLTPRAALWHGPFVWLGGLAERRPLPLLFITLSGLSLAAVPLSRYLRDPFEWQLDNLKSETTDAERRWSRMYALGMGNVGAGYIGTDGVLLVDRPDQAEPVATALREKDKALGKNYILREVRTIHSVLPKEQEEKLAILSRIRERIDHNRDKMSDEEWREASNWRPPESLHVLGTNDLPRRLRENFTEADGQVGRLIGIDAEPNQFIYPGGNNGHDVIRIANALQVDAFGKHWMASSSSTILAGMLEIIIRDGPRVTFAALCGVTVLLLVAFRGLGALPVLGSLLIGVLGLGGMLAAMKMKLNFVNFVGLPITLGIGVDYAANIWARLRADGLGRVAHVIADTGSAVTLCSLTTIIGYSSLLLASSRALRSFGWLADMGEVSCLLAALLALPAAVQLVKARPGTELGKLP